MKVTLLSHTPNPERLIAAAARLCYSPSEISELFDSLTAEKVEKFINKLVELGHESPLEHVTFTFGIEGISRACSHQLVRHRIASYSHKSQRYVNEGNFDYIIPFTIDNNDITRYLYLTFMEQCQETYNALIAEGVPAEDARFVLPNATSTSIIVTMNIRSLLNFFYYRCCNRAQWEIRAVAKEMLKQCKEVSPLLFKKAGPGCTTGACPEGTMSCKKETP